LAAPVAALSYLAAAALVFSSLRLFLPVATPVFVVAPAALLVAIFIRYRFARALTMRLAPAPVAKRMLAKVTDHRDMAVSHEATVVFFDLIGSSGIGERLSPLDFSRLLNTYFDTVTVIVERHRGLISGYIGDGIMAVFRDSIRGQNHAVLACHAAVAAIRGISDVNTSNARNHFPQLRVRIGINSGRVAEGEIGARDRFNFSVVGDVVNLAARLERLGKRLFPGETNIVLVGRTTQRMCEHADLEFVDCGMRAIEGRERQEQVYRLIVH
jgi:adenylate cyclase